MNRHEPAQPGELAQLLLAASRNPPRQRARDQHADRQGMQLRQLLLQKLIELDPDVEQLDATLLQIVEQMGPPTGPARAVALHVREELRAALADPGFVRHLLVDALSAAEIRPGGMRER